eukprot:2615326-Lingulodinium_polyedra.AAC.1
MSAGSGAGDDGLTPTGAMFAVHVAKSGEHGHLRTTCPTLYRANGLPRDLLTSQIPPGAWGV